MRDSNARRVEMPVARFFVCLALLLWSGAGLAQEASKKVALVIGNSAYQAPHGAASATNDGRVMTDALKALGFEVFAFSDLNQRKMHRALLDFRETLRERGSDTVAFVFFAGTALELHGQNYLIPVDARIESPGDIDFETVSLTTVLNVLKSVETRALILAIDACYRNPFVFVPGGLAAAGVSQWRPYRILRDARNLGARQLRQRHQSLYRGACAGDCGEGDENRRRVPAGARHRQRENARRANPMGDIGADGRTLSRRCGRA